MCILRATRLPVVGDERCDLRGFPGELEVELLRLDAGDFGWGLTGWRTSFGALQCELDGVNPKVIVLLAGTTCWCSPGMMRRSGYQRGLKAVIDVCTRRLRGLRLSLRALSGGMTNGALPTIKRINENLARLANGKSVRF